MFSEQSKEQDIALLDLVKQKSVGYKYLNFKDLTVYEYKMALKEYYKRDIIFIGTLEDKLEFDKKLKKSSK